ncbi:MAG: ComF family protein [Ruminococcaceae bacterium]|nr:ComF family protein [Oscillospiraceae bacterium]
MNKITKWFNRVLDIFYVKKCVACGELLTYDHDGYLCPKCEDEWTEAKELLCEHCMEMQKNCRCGFGRQYVDGVRHLAIYDHDEHDYITNRIVYALKKGGFVEIFDFVSEEMANELVEKRMLQNAVVVNVPRNPKSIKKYGYDHARKLAVRLADRLELEYVDFLRHSRSKTEQKMLNKEQRDLNAKTNCYARQKYAPKIKGKTVLLVDDIGTTGAMTGACASLLHRHGADKIYCILAAKNK